MELWKILVTDRLVLTTFLDGQQRDNYITIHIMHLLFTEKHIILMHYHSTNGMVICCIRQITITILCMICLYKTLSYQIQITLFSFFNLAKLCIVQ